MFFLSLLTLAAIQVQSENIVADKWAPYWNDDASIEAINPLVKVQSVLGEGIGWEGTASAEQTSNHVVISISGKDETSGQTIPYAKRVILVKSTAPLACVIEQGNGGFDDCKMSSETVRSFTTNSFGRISFSVPMKDQLALSHESLIPAIMIQAEYMPHDEWVVAHIDGDAQYLMTKLDVNHIKSLNSSISTHSANELTSAFRYIMALSSEHELHSEESVLERRDKQKTFSYDPIKNNVNSFVAKVDSSIDLNKAFNRIISYTGKYKRDSLEPKLIARDNDNEWEIKHGDTLSTSTDNGRTLHLVKTVEGAWSAVRRIMKKIGLSLFNILDAIKRFFSYDDILLTNRFLGKFYRLLSPLGINGMQVLKYRYKSLLINSTDYIQTAFENVTRYFGAEDMTLLAMRENSQKKANYILNANNENMSKFSINETSNLEASVENFDPFNADARTHFLQDRIVNNLENADLEKVTKTHAWNRMLLCVQDFSTALENVISWDTLTTAQAHTLKFAKHTNFFKMGLAQVFNYLRSLMSLTEQISGKVLEAIINILPLYWNLAVEVMMTPLHLPFLYTFWTKKIARGTSDFSFLDILTLPGSIYATYMYKAFNRNKAPFNEKDIAVLMSVQDPELLLYTWNNDPSTYAMDSPQLQRHRLGIYDWIPRMQMTIVGTIQTVVFGVTAWIGGGTTNDPGPLAKIPQVFNAIASIMGRIQGYPFTQLDSNDRAVVEKSKLNPDQRFLGFWTYWVIEDVVRFARPFMGPKFNSYPGYAILNSLIIGIPLTLYGVTLNIESAKQIGKHDWPRLAVISTYFFEISLMYVDLLLPFFEQSAVNRFISGSPELTELKNRIDSSKTDLFKTKEKTLIKTLKETLAIEEDNLKRHVKGITSPFLIYSNWKNAVSTVSTYTRNAILVGCHVVGMLSSSWQGGVRDGDGARPDHIWYE